MKTRSIVSLLLLLTFAAGFIVFPVSAAGDYVVDISRPTIIGENNNIYQYAITNDIGLELLEAGAKYRYVVAEIGDGEDIWGFIFSSEQSGWDVREATQIPDTNFWYADLRASSQSHSPSEWGNFSVGINGETIKQVYFTDTLPGSGNEEPDDEPVISERPKGETVVLEDFEANKAGDKFTMVKPGEVSENVAEAVVTADPKGDGGNVIKVTNSGWDQWAIIPVTLGYTLDDYKEVSLKLYVTGTPEKFSWKKLRFAAGTPGFINPDHLWNFEVPDGWAFLEGTHHFVGETDFITKDPGEEGFADGGWVEIVFPLDGVDEEIKNITGGVWFAFSVSVDDGVTYYLNDITIVSKADDASEPDGDFDPDYGFNLDPVNEYKEGQFTDVAPWAEKYVAAIYGYGLMNSVSDSKFGAAEKLTYSELYTVAAKIHAVCRYGGLEIIGEVAADVAAKNGWDETGKPADMYVDYLWDRKAISHYAWEDYYWFGMADRTLTRADLAIVCANILPVSELEPVRKYQGFPDVSKESPAYDAAVLLYEAGIINGNGAGFLPGSIVTRDMAATIFAQIFDKTLRG